MYNRVNYEILDLWLGINFQTMIFFPSAAQLVIRYLYLIQTDHGNFTGEYLLKLIMCIHVHDIT